MSARRIVAGVAVLGLTALVCASVPDAAGRADDPKAKPAAQPHANKEPEKAAKARRNVAVFVHEGGAVMVSGEPRGSG